MATQMPSVAQFTLPQPNQQAQDNPASQPTTQGMPPVAQFQLPANAAQQSQNSAPSDVNSYISPALRMGTKKAPTAQEGQDYLKGTAKGLLSTLESANSLDAAHKLAGQPTLKDVTGVDPNEVSKPTNPSEQSGATMSEIGAGLLPVGESKAVVGTTKGLIGKALTGSKDEVLTAVSPRLTPKVAAETATKTKGLLGKITPVATKQLQKVADAVRPYFDPKATWSTNAQVANDAIGTEAKTLESEIDKVNHPVVIKELGARLSNAPEPISLKGTSFEKQIAPLKKAAVNLTKQSGGTVKGTFQALRKFDDLVDKTWPTLWDRENAPMRNAVTAIRNEWKDFIAENLPDEAMYRDSLDKQTSLFDARDTFREKAALGELQQQGEIGTNALDRTIAKHPLVTGLLKGGVQTGVGLGLGAAGLDAWNKLHP